MESTNIEWNKNVEYYELGNIIQTNLSDETLQLINEKYSFLICKVHVVKIFFIVPNENDKITFSSVTYKDYSCNVKEIWNFKEDLEKIICKYDIIKDKKICLINSITKQSNYHRIRYMYIDIENNVTVECLKSIIRKEKIKLLLDNSSNKKNYKNHTQDIKNLLILTEEI